MPIFSEYTGGRYAKGEIGIEVETESTKEYTYPTFDFWHPHADGSLRNFGVEYVLASPLDFNSAAYKAALQEFENFAKKIKFQESVYASIHVHLNMSKKQMAHIVNFICLYLLAEEVLGKYCGPDRNGNLFCLKTSSAEGNLDGIIALIRQLLRGPEYGRNAIQRLNAGSLKYAGMNIVPLRNFGSIEIRTHGATVDTDKIHRWISILNCLYRASEEYRDPLEILSMFKNGMTYTRFFQQTFKNFTQYLDLSNLEREMREPLWYMSSVASMTSDWSKFCELPNRADNKLEDVYLTQMRETVETVTAGRRLRPRPVPPLTTNLAGTWADMVILDEQGDL